MLHVGDITKLSGHTLPPVDVIIGGSPCQDLSIAGKGAGLAGNRSGLFMEQLRIVKELRDEDRKRGRTGISVRPRFMVWENVPGAFSSNRGRDFQVVLQETIRIAQPDAPDIPRPKKWPLADAYFGDGWSIAYRVFDAQFWGVPQRRRRICLVADFGGRAAAEILFVRESLSGNIETGGTPRKETAPRTGGGAYPTVAKPITARGDNPGIETGANIVAQGFPLGFRPENTRLYDETATTVCNGTRPGFTCGILQQGAIPIHDKATRYQGGGPTRNGDGAGNGLGVGRDGDPCPTLSTADRHAVFAAGFSYGQGAKARSIGYQEELNPTLRGGEGSDQRPCVYDARGNGDGKTVNTLTGDHGNRVTDYTALVMSVHQNQSGEVRIGEVANTLSTNGNASGRNAPLVFGLDSEHNAYPEQSGTLRAHCSGGTEQKVVVAVDCRDGTESDVNGTLQAKESGGYSVNCQNVVRVIANIIYGIVRRLTPLECERLQGFPDGWTDIGTWTDSKGKERKTSDSARYRALGNSIALPPWKWVLKRLSAQYERDALMGSLFDGIGGFPLIWEQINGKGSCIWASEIEEFCIAVTKRRFQ